MVLSRMYDALCLRLMHFKLTACCVAAWRPCCSSATITLCVHKPQSTNVKCQYHDGCNEHMLGCGTCMRGVEVI